MSYDVPISINRGHVLPDVFDWLLEQDLFQKKHWDYTKPDYFKNDWDFTFTFKQQEHAVLFALRWA